MSITLGFSNDRKHVFNLLKTDAGKWLFIVTSVLCLMIGQAHASVNNPFQTTQTVTDQSTKVRQIAFQSGMLVVLQALSGSDQLKNNTSITQALDNATQYVSSYSYVDIPVPDNPNTLDTRDTGSDTPQTQLALRINFDPTAIKALLKNNHYPVWLSTRPPILIWFDQQDSQNNHSLLSDSSNAPLQQTLKQTFSVLDLNINFPILDFQDISALPQQALTDLDHTTIMKASARYKTPAVFVIHCYPSDENTGAFSGTFNFFFQNKVYQQDFSDLTPSTMAAAATTLAVKPMAAFYGMDQSQKKIQTLTIKVTGIDTLKDYAAVSHYLKQQALITQVQPKKITSNSSLFTITARGDNTQIAVSFALDQHLIPEKQPETQQDNTTASTSNAAESAEQPIPSLPMVFHWYP